MICGSEKNFNFHWVNAKGSYVVLIQEANKTLRIHQT